ncbi:Meiotically up-regulated protein 86 protein [Mycoemilia scoparia]|uniref:Meiotically up-regulated protein 86 protein n=1 Tax=Mycoemilia scoparia TaxID=417184 RepID=A0A9W8A1P0_9FUNG|nr:Meiotically up-regulated protein 86 protein [Mycoemilia scoparia]
MSRNQSFSRPSSQHLQQMTSRHEASPPMSTLSGSHEHYAGGNSGYPAYAQGDVKVMPPHNQSIHEDIGDGNIHHHHHHYYHPVPQATRQLGSGAPMALVTFAITTMQTNMYKAAIGQPYEAGTASVAASSFFVGGFCQIIGGVWQLANGNSFEGAAFVSFGGFWMAKAATMIPWFGVSAALAQMSEYDRAHHMGIYMVPWSIWVFILLLGQFKSTAINIVMFILLNLNVHFDTAANFTNSVWCHKLSGWFGFFLAMLAFYNAAVILIDRHNFFLDLPVGAWYKEKVRESTPSDAEDGHEHEKL